MMDFYHVLESALFFASGSAMSTMRLGPLSTQKYGKFLYFVI